jgi:hypothetical protein
MKWRIDQFNGLNPAIDDSKLAEGLAQDCLDVHYEYGSLTGMKMPTPLGTNAPTTTRFVAVDDVGRVYLSDNLLFGIAQASAYSADIVYTTDSVLSNGASFTHTVAPPSSITVSTIDSATIRLLEGGFQNIAHLWKRYEDITDAQGAENPIYGHIGIIHTNDSTIASDVTLPAELKNRVQLSTTALPSDVIKGVDAATGGATDDEYTLTDTSFLANIAANYGIDPATIEAQEATNALTDIADCGTTPTPLPETFPQHALFDDKTHAELYPNFIPCAYTITFIDSLGRESAPCEPFSILDPSTSDHTHEIKMPAVPTGTAAIRVYRAVANAQQSSDPTAGQSNYLVIADLPPNTTNWIVTVDKDDSGSHLLTTHPYIPLANLPLLAETESGHIITASSNAMQISLKHYWHGWTDRRRVVLRKGAIILDIMTKANIVMIMTSTGNYTIAIGDDSGIGGMAMSVFEVDTPLIMKAGIRATRTDYGCCYVSDHGLVAFDGRNIRSITERIVPPREWLEYHSTCTCVQIYRGKTYIFYASGCLILNLQDSVFGNQVVDIVKKSSVSAIAACVTNDERMLLVKPDGSMAIWKPDEPDATTLWEWSSRDQEISERIQITAGRITGDFNGQLSITTDELLLDTYDKISSNTDSFRTRRGDAKVSLQLKLKGSGTLRSITLGSTRTAVHGS